MLTEKCILKHSRKHLLEIPQITALITFIESESTPLQKRISELQEAHLKAMSLMEHDNPEKYPNVLQLKQTLNQKNTQLDTSPPSNIGCGNNISRHVNKTFIYITEHINDEWIFVSATPDQKQLMSKMLVKGFARLLQFCNTHVPNLADQYEAAILEVLKNDFPDSELGMDLLK